MAKRSGSTGSIIWLLIVGGLIVLINAPSLARGNFNLFSLVVPALVLYAVVSGIRGSTKKKPQPRVPPGFQARPGPNIEPTEAPHPRPTPSYSPSPSPSPPPPVNYPRPSAPAPTSSPAYSAPPVPSVPTSPLQPSGVEPSADVIAQATKLKKSGRTIEAISVLREATGMELYEASQYIRKL